MARKNAAEVAKNLAALDKLFSHDGPKSAERIADTLGIGRGEVNSWILLLRDNTQYADRGAVGQFRVAGQYLYGYCDQVEQYYAWELRQLKRVRGKARRQKVQAENEFDLHPSELGLRDSVRYWARALEDAEDRIDVVEQVTLVHAW